MISYGRQSINRSDAKSLRRVLKSEWLTLGPQIQKFEDKISRLIQSESFVVSSGTAALHCAYAAINLSPGDEIISPPNTFVATQAAAMHFGAKIVFCDIDKRTGNIDHSLIENLVTKKTKAITVVDFAGQPANLEEIRKLTDRYGLYFIEDAAHSLGSKYKLKPIGSIADLTTFSFFPTKNITTAEGGAVAAKDPNLLDKARKFGRQGMIKDPNRFLYTPDGPWHQEVHEIGLNYRLPDLLCALGISQIERINDFKIARQEIFDYYFSELNRVELIELPFRESFADPIWHLFPIKVNYGLRNKLHKYLADNNIFAQVNYVPAYYHPVFQKMGYKRGLCPISEEFYQQELSLPIYPGLKRKELRKIIKVIKNFCASQSLKSHKEL
jgi:dTDP-4-amino-4,6-dideoxygalactose transaminase